MYHHHQNRIQIFLLLLALVVVVVNSKGEKQKEKRKEKVEEIEAIIFPPQCKCPPTVVSTVQQRTRNRSSAHSEQEVNFKKKPRFQRRHKTTDNDNVVIAKRTRRQSRLEESSKDDVSCSKNIENVIKDATRAKNFWLSSEVTMRNDLQDLKEKMERVVSWNERAASEAEATEVHVHIFKIQGFNERRLKGNSVVRADFYTSPHGYKIVSKVYLNGKGRANGTHVSLTVAVERGDWDDILAWPVMVNLTFSIMDQRETRDKYHFTRHVNSTADYRQIVIERPTAVNGIDDAGTKNVGTTGKMNLGETMGEEEKEVVFANLEQFALHSDLLRDKELYIVKDTLFVRMKIVLKTDEE